MKVCYVFSRFPAPSETFAGTDIRVLREAGVDVRAFNLRPPHPDAAALLEQWGLADLAVLNLTPANVIAGLGFALLRPGLLLLALGTIARDSLPRPRDAAKSLLLLPSLFSVLRRLMQLSPDVVHLFWGHYPALLGIVARRAMPKTVVTLFLGAYDLRAAYRTSVTLAAQADGVFTHASANLPVLQERGVDVARVTVVHRGLDLERFTRGGEARVPLRIVTAGRLADDKGFDRVIDAFTAVKEAWPEASLVVLGDGPARASLERRVAERRLRDVTFTGHVDHRRVFRQMEQADVLLFLSPSECLPNVVKEGMLAGCGVVVSRTMGIEELVVEGEDGFVVPVDDVDAAARCVDTLLRDPALRRRLSESAVRRVTTSFDARRSMRAYEEAWARMITARRGSSAS